MADLKKLAQGRKAFEKPAKAAESAPDRPTKSLEESCRDEIGEAEQAFRDRLGKEDARKRMATDSEFWFAVYFQSRAEKEMFLRKYGLAKIGDKYLSGSMVDNMLSARLNRQAKDSHKR